jgi:hypothetical protein
MYICELCNYETNDSGNFCRHRKQKKHLDKAKALNDVEKIKKENDELKQKLLEKEFREKLLEKEFKEKLLEKENEKLEAINKIYQEQSIKGFNNTQNNTINIGTLNYINENFKDAPPLEKITDFVINGIDTNDVNQYDKFISNAIYHHNNKNLHAYLGDHIVSIYKKKNLNEQSIHTTDTSRLNYAIRIIEESLDLYDTSEEEIDRYKIKEKKDSENDDSDNHSDDEELEQMKQDYIKKLKEKELKQIKKINSKVWVSDKSGYKTCKLVVEPIIRRMLRILKRKLKERNINKVKDFDEELKYRNNISSIIDSIDTKKLKNEINKYIAPKFNLDKK